MDGWILFLTTIMERSVSLSVRFPPHKAEPKSQQNTHTEGHGACTEGHKLHWFTSYTLDYGCCFLTLSQVESKKFIL